MVESFITWAFSLIVTAAPLEHTRFEAAKETREEAAERYQDIARDLMAVVYDPQEPPLFRGPQGRAKTAALLLSIASYESHFRKDVDLGLGSRARGDGGKSWCLGQINLGHPTKDGSTPRRIGVDQQGFYVRSPSHGFSGQDLVEDRQKCFKAMLWVARTSLSTCKRYYGGQRPESHLNLYVSGNCSRGHESSAKRMVRAKKWARKIPLQDEDVLSTSTMLPLPVELLPFVAVTPR